MFQAEYEKERVAIVMKLRNGEDLSNANPAAALFIAIPVITLANLAWLFQVFLAVKNNGWVVFKKI